MSARKMTAQLLVEGKNDKHVIWSLCRQHDVEKTFSVETPSDDNGGIDKLLNSISVRLKIPRLTALGIVLDADQNLEGRWQSIKNRLEESGYANLSSVPNPEGTIINIPEKPRVGIWIMPNNQLPGMLEHFVAHLIPEEDELASKAENVLQDIEHENLNRYPLKQHPKAFIHTWLAWQKVPGQPMGQAITAHSLNHNALLANSFVGWLQRLFTDA